MPLKLKLKYSEAEIAIIKRKAGEAGFTNINRYVRMLLLKRMRKLELLEPIDPGKLKNIHIWVNDPEVMKKLVAHANLRKMSITVLIKRLTTEPILLEELLKD